MKNNCTNILDATFEMPPFEELLSQAEMLRGATSAATGEIFLWRSGEYSFLVKSFARKGWFSRMLIGRICISNEWRLLNALREKGFDCAPLPIAKFGSHTIVMEFIEGEELKDARHYSKDGEKPLPMEFYSRLRDLVMNIHKAGFSHGDFRRANVIVQKDGTPRIIDWATGMMPGNMHFILLRMFLESDIYSLEKIIDESYPELLTDTERKSMHPGVLLRMGRFMRQKIYRGFIKPLRKKIRHRR